ncbi:hypothetical protein MPSEU_001031300 [Mayamaea pseudoterrestris]|nr:hypothetical protein MPSEU_001031300 [Mayamaea pseudoterrestris]
MQATLRLAAMTSSSSSQWNTALTRSVPLRLPIISAPMAGVAGGKMAAETCRAGGLGFVAAGYNDNMQQVEEQVEIFRKHAPLNAPLSLGFIGFAALQNESGWERFEQLLIKHQPQFIQFFAPSIMYHGKKEAGDDDEDDTTKLVSNVQLAHEHNCKFIAQVGTFREAQQAVHAGVDCLIAQGSEAGGHGMRRELGSSTLALSSLLVQEFGSRVPIVAAGGIMNGRAMAAALALGCDGVVLGTRLWASVESIGSPAVQAQLLGKTCDDVLRTTVFDQFNNAVAPTKWPRPYDSVGALRNDATERWDGRYDELQEELAKSDSQILSDFNAAQAVADPAKLRVLCGEGVGHVDSVSEGTYDIIMRIEQEAKDCIRGLTSVLPE